MCLHTNTPTPTLVFSLRLDLFLVQYGHVPPSPLCWFCCRYHSY